MTRLEQIKNALSSFGAVRYGVFPKNIQNSDNWDYIVYRRSELVKVDNNYKRLYFVIVVRENYIPEDLDAEIIKAIEEIGLKFSGSAPYDYAFKGQTDKVVELLTLTFTEPLKGCKFRGE